MSEASSEEGNPRRRELSDDDDEEEEDNAPATVPMIDNPRETDVLLGRGKPFQNHHGNLVLNSHLHEHRARYQRARKTEKRNIGRAILTEFQLRGVRFLKRVDESLTGTSSPVEGSTNIVWFEVSDDEAINKICHTLRKNKVDVVESTVGGSVSRINFESPDQPDGEVGSRKRKKSPGLDRSFQPKAYPRESTGKLALHPDSTSDFRPCSYVSLSSH